jgi:hypothetical protein
VIGTGGTSGNLAGPGVIAQGGGTGGPTCFAGVGVVATGWRYGLRNGITTAGVHQAISPRLEYLPRADSGRSPIALV